MSASRRAFLAGLAGFAAPANAHHACQAGAATDEFGAAMHRQMKSVMRAMNAAPMTGNADRDFLAMMVPHHQGAIEMARLVLVHGRDPLTRQIAEEIIASQQAEISSMQRRLELLGRKNQADEEFPNLSGTRG